MWALMPTGRSTSTPLHSIQMAAAKLLRSRRITILPWRRLRIRRRPGIASTDGMQRFRARCRRRMWASMPTGRSTSTPLHSIQMVAAQLLRSRRTIILKWRHPWIRRRLATPSAAGILRFLKRCRRRMCALMPTGRSISTPLHSIQMAAVPLLRSPRITILPWRHPRIRRRPGIASTDGMKRFRARCRRRMWASMPTGRSTSTPLHSIQMVAAQLLRSRRTIILKWRHPWIRRRLATPSAAGILRFLKRCLRRMWP